MQKTSVNLGYRSQGWESTVCQFKSKVLQFLKLEQDNIKLLIQCLKKILKEHFFFFFATFLG